MKTPLAFYAPLKPPTDPKPSGDRRMARLLMAALREAGFDVHLASRFRSLSSDAEAGRQQKLEATGGRLAERLIRKYRAQPPEARPKLWFTYHLYYKAPDWIGPRVAAALDIPYVAAEASHAEKRATGVWARNHAAALAAMRQARLVVNVNSADRPGLLQAGVPAADILDIKPFLAEADLDGLPSREAARRRLAARLALDPADRWLLAVGMMRQGPKDDSYQVLAEALPRLRATGWSLIVAGDGPLRDTVRARLSAAAGDKVAFAGLLSREQMKEVHAAADLFVWPSVGEAYGMALLEALGAGVPVVTGRAGGVPDLVTDGENGRLVPGGDAAVFARAIDDILETPGALRDAGRNAAERVRAEHLLSHAAALLSDRLYPLLRDRHAA